MLKAFIILYSKDFMQLVTSVNIACFLHSFLLIWTPSLYFIYK